MKKTAKHAPLQPNNGGWVFNSIAEWVILHPGCMAIGYCEKTFVHGNIETLRFNQVIPAYWVEKKS
jgi:hypothetical protein